MERDAITYAVWAVVLTGIALSFGVTYRNRWLRSQRARLMDLFNQYFRGDVSADQLGARARQIVSRHFTAGSQFYSLAIASFQSAIDAGPAHQMRSEDRQTQLLKALAALKNEFGLTDRYRVEGWRAGRE